MKNLWCELVRLERADWRLYGKFKLPSERGGKQQPVGRWERVESARSVVRERIDALKAALDVN